MFVKIRGTDENVESWRWYEADRVQSGTKPFKEWCNEEGLLNLIQGDGINEEEMLSPTDYPTKQCEEEALVTLITFTSPDGTVNNVFCNTRAFLLNDAGETIDRLL
jgi:hypothetical protein